MNNADDARRGLVSVGALLETRAVRDLIRAYSRPVVVAAVRAVLDQLRTSLVAEGGAAPAAADVALQVAAALEQADLDRLRPAVNATGVVLHTGLGRAVLPPAASEALSRTSAYCNLQIDLATGSRGKRNHASEQLLCRLTGAEAALLVNNNAAATLLVLACFCQGREVIVSRGQLIEIGGSFRLPDCIRQSGATLVEVGTTNKTHLRDYQAAITENTAAVLRVNPSNYRVIGFSKQVPVTDLATLRDAHPVLVIDDLGCGALVDLERFGLPHEPTVQESVLAGADLVCFSGDKLIGGPQVGIVVGRQGLIDRMRRHPLTRMLRVGKLTDLALEHTLRLFLTPETLPQQHPVYRMLAAAPRTLGRRATRLRRRILAECPGLTVQTQPDESAVGGGTLPGCVLATRVLAVRSQALSAERLCELLRRCEPPVVCRIKHDEVVLDMRTLQPGDDARIVQAFSRVTQDHC